MLIEHLGQEPTVHESAYVAPTAVICGDVTLAAGACVAFGAVVSAEGGSISIGEGSVVRENAIVCATSSHSVTIGRNVLVGPRSSLIGCDIEDEVFLATGVCVLHAARIERGTEVRVNGVVHVRTVLPPRSMVPIGWVAVGDPAEVLPPDQHERIWDVQQHLDFPGVAYGLERDSGGDVDMRDVTARLATALARHRTNRVVD